MKKTTLCLILVCSTHFLSAQNVALDSGFGINGKLTTGLNGMIGNYHGIDFAALPNGEIIIGGGFNNYVGLEKYNNSGAKDPDFADILLASDGFEVGVSAQKDGKTLMIGENTTSLSSFAARFDTLGNLDAEFGSSGIVQTDISYFLTHHIFEQMDGKVIVFGDERTNTSRFSALRLLPNGKLDPFFANNGKLSIDLPAFAHEVPFAAQEQADHTLTFAGSIGYPDWNVMLVRVHPDGSLDTTFGENGILIDPIQGNSNAYAMTIQADGKILIAGDSGPDYQAFVARYHPNGSRDLNFGTQGVQLLTAFKEAVGIAITAEGKILTTAWSSNATLGNLGLIQLLPNGQRDLAFGNNGIFRVVDAGMLPRALSLVGNKATISARNPAGTTLKQLFRFTLDLNVGTLHPNDDLDPNLWIYPNPVVDGLNLEFELAQKAPVSIQLFDMQGALVSNFIQNQVFESGLHSLRLSCPESLASGNYVLCLTLAGKKMKTVQLWKN